MDVTVLGEEPLVDANYVTDLRTHHRICVLDEDEPKYELIASGPEDRVCFGRASDEDPHFFLCMRVFLLDWEFFYPFLRLRFPPCTTAVSLLLNSIPTLGVS